MTAVPTLMAVTRPLSDTDAMAASLLDHVTFLYAALLGATVAVSCSGLPSL
jgi:hypothetical protein